MPLCFMRPGSFLENYVPNLAWAKSTGMLETYLTPNDRAVPMVSSQDVGHEIVRRLVTDWTGRSIVEMGSMISPDELGRAMGEVIGRPVQARAIPQERWEAGLAERGMPPGFIGPFLEREEGYNTGWIGFGVPGTERVHGTTTPSQVVAVTQATPDRR